MSEPSRKRQPPLSVEISVSGIPEVEAALRREMGRLLREVADDEPPAVAQRLREIAALFETALPSE